MVEGNPADVELLRCHLAKTVTPIHLTVVDDGEDAIDVLGSNAKYSKVLRPDLILLDLNVPELGGFDVLKTVKSDKKLRDIPVLIWSDSSDEVHRKHADELQADGYFSKEPETKGCDGLVQSINTLCLNGHRRGRQ